jgi:hypothetical protein
MDCTGENIYSQTCLIWPSKGTMKYGHIRQMVTLDRFNWCEIQCEGKYKYKLR